MIVRNVLQRARTPGRREMQGATTCSIAWRARRPSGLISAGRPCWRYCPTRLNNEELLRGRISGNRVWVKSDLLPHCAWINARPRPCNNLRKELRCPPEFR